MLSIKGKNSPKASFEDIRAVSPPEPLRKRGNLRGGFHSGSPSSKPLCNLSNLRAKRQSGGSRR